MRETTRHRPAILRADRGTGLIEGATYVPSPNCDDRPPGCAPELVVVHGISLPPGVFGGPWIERLFTNCLPPDEHPYFAEVCALRVSAHALIRRDGTVVQFVPLSLRAWHAGTSSWRGRERCNDFSIGIELEGADHVPYEEAQYTSLAVLVTTLLDAYPALGPDTIAGHSDIAPGRKTDPGPAFEWPRFHALLRQRLALPAPGAAT
jgi:AmpD protein